MSWLQSREAVFSLIGHFILPDEAWWGVFYASMEIHIGEGSRK